MTGFRALGPALFGGLVLAGLLYWAGSTTHALSLPGATNFLGPDQANRLKAWTTPWSTDVPSSPQFTSPAGASGHGADYVALRETAMRVRYAALILIFSGGAALLLRRLSGRTAMHAVARTMALWGWGITAAMLAVTVSAPWAAASGGSATHQLLPTLASTMSQGRDLPLVAALAAAAATTGLTALLSREPVSTPHPPTSIPTSTARLAATLGTAVILFALTVPSNQKVAAYIQTGFTGNGRLSEPGDLLRQWLQLSAWTTPTGPTLGRWLLYRLGEVVLVATVWWALRLLPTLFDHVTVPAYALGAAAATTLGAEANDMWHSLLTYQTVTGGPLLYYISTGSGASAALVFGSLAGCASTVAVRRHIRAQSPPPAEPQRRPVS
ncbi:hypothetical protein [Streptomyces sp. CB02460]|uniref:hypothetical protein n=1 Tax=Streptomyces sp. CB02460 TaxID=1703941 RepID=UPI00093DBF3D|nr:hypothetical protein [Streptomyces sp. CB02460]OKJ68727.1 hypothetical protein AMK30_30345 [Streptomyces sp. CB02460]